ncbi:hypothetical protein M6B38_201370 [Iris pallida]|uniref:ATP synthase F0 subunit 8 n=1 Tax=Iris pallida TaxID=29817 RepID=A0AAX6E9S2_IRIPA|nr:hypothetical protein M6B38_201370 [Iris pallida]
MNPTIIFLIVPFLFSSLLNLLLPKRESPPLISSKESPTEPPTPLL